MPRPRSNCYSDLGFQYIKNENKYEVVCNVCNKTLRNTAETRLKAHRNICRLKKNKVLNINVSQNVEASVDTADVDVDVFQIDSNEDIAIANSIDFNEDNQNASVENVQVLQVYEMASSETSESESHSHRDQLSSSNQTLTLSASSSTSGIVDVYHPQPYKQSKKKTQSLRHFMDVLSNTEEAELNETLAEFIFACNLPFTVTESVYFKRFVAKLRPSYQSKIPSRKTLSTTLLNKVYDKCISKAFSSDEQECVVLIDGWKNSATNSKTVVCMLHNANGTRAFPNAWDLSGQSETAEKLSEIIHESCCLAKKLYNAKIYATVSDNASPMVKMGKLVNHVVWHSTCSSHTANLLAKDVTDKVLTNKVTTVLKEFKHSQWRN